LFIALSPVLIGDYEEFIPMVAEKWVVSKKVLGMFFRARYLRQDGCGQVVEFKYVWSVSG